MGDELLLSGVPILEVVSHIIISDKHLLSGRPNMPHCSGRTRSFMRLGLPTSATLESNNFHICQRVNPCLLSASL